MYNTTAFKHEEYIEFQGDHELYIDQNHSNLIVSEYNDEIDYRTIYEHFHKILNVDSETSADQFVLTLKQYFSIAELVKLYYNISNKDTKKYKQVNRARIHSTTQLGGLEIKNDKGPELTEQELAIYRFLLIFDTIHDFNSDKEHGENIEEIDQFINENIHCFPLVADANTMELITFPIHLVENEEKCIETLASMPKLKFINDIVVDNPFYLLDIGTLDIYTQDKPITYKDFIIKCINSNTHKSHKKSFSVELFGSSTFVDNKTDPIWKLEYNCLLRLLYYINTMTDYARLDFQIDNINEPYCKLLFSLSYIQGAMEKLFLVDPEIKAYLENNQLGNMDNSPWFATYSDANIFDPSITFSQKSGIEKFMRDDRPTGSIYHFSMPYQIYLDGLRFEPAKPNKQKINTNMTIAELDIDDTFNIYGSLSEDTFGIKPLKKLINLADELKEVKPKKQASIDRLLANYKIETLLAIKRAGDWGQVENCKKYNKIFVTGDRYAAIYAYWRRVPTLLIRTKSTVKDLENLNIIDIANYPNFTKFSFIILNPNK